MNDADWTRELVRDALRASPEVMSVYDRKVAPIVDKGLTLPGAKPEELAANVVANLKRLYPQIPAI